MNERYLGYLGGGILVAVIGLTLIGVPPAITMSAAVVAAFVGLAVIAHEAKERDTAETGRVVPESAPTSGQASPRADATTDGKPVSVELVRPADDATGSPEVWFHRCGGRRVHRYASADGWVVEQVSTKDPDNPKKRVIGQALTFASEAEAVQAADDLARGMRPSVPRSSVSLEPTLSVAEARA